MKGLRTSSSEYRSNRSDLNNATRLMASSRERSAGSKLASMKYTAPIIKFLFIMCTCDSVTIVTSQNYPFYISSLWTLVDLLM